MPFGFFFAKSKIARNCNHKNVQQNITFRQINMTAIFKYDSLKEGFFFHKGISVYFFYISIEKNTKEKHKMANLFDS